MSEALALEPAFSTTVQQAIKSTLNKINKSKENYQHNAH
jgi:hypothetical protein